MRISDWSSDVCSSDLTMTMTGAPDAHFYSEVRYRGAKSVVIAPDYNEAAKFADLWLHPKQGTDAALALALGHVVLREIGRASCRDRVCQYVYISVVAVSLQKKQPIPS